MGLKLISTQVVVEVEVELGNIDNTTGYLRRGNLDMDPGGSLVQGAYNHG